MLEALPLLELLKCHWEEGCFLGPQEPTGLLNQKRSWMAFASYCFKSQARAAAVGEMPIFPGGSPGVQNLTRRYLCTVLPDFCQVYWQGRRHFWLGKEVGMPFLEAAGLPCVMEDAVGGSLLGKSTP